MKLAKGLQERAQIFLGDGKGEVSEEETTRLEDERLRRVGGSLGVSGRRCRRVRLGR
jgi:hypothetical protein